MSGQDRPASSTVDLAARDRSEKVFAMEQADVHEVRADRLGQPLDFQIVGRLRSTRGTMAAAVFDLQSVQWLG